jgi:dethiobiotin synthetase
MGAPPPPSAATLAYECNLISADAEFVLVEGAGGILVPISERETTADLAEHCGLPLVIISRDALGVLSYTLTAFEAARHRQLPVAAVVLTSHQAADPDVSSITNAEILERILPDIPVLVMPYAEHESDEALASLAENAALVDSLLASIGWTDPKAAD